MLHHALALPADEVWHAHQEAKEALLEAVLHRTGRRLRSDALTLGFARRATSYKRAHLVLSDLDRLRAMGKNQLQFVFAGKAHPRDDPDKQGIRAILHAARQLGEDVPVVR